MPLTSGAKDFGTAIAAVYRRYAEWLVSISWKRFFVLSILLMIVAGVLSNMPPFSWDLATRKVSRGPTRSDPARNVDVTIDDHGVQIRRKASSGKPPREVTIDDQGVHIKRNPDEPEEVIKPEPSELASLADEIRREVVAGLRDQGDTERTVHVRLGNYLPSLAFLFIMLSAVMKVAYAGRIKAEVRAAEAQEAADAESLKRQVVEARMAAMQAQVEPHFLFNTLASIDHLIEVDPPRASRMQKNLIALLRASMPAMRERATNLGRELEVVRPYLEILKVRMEERLRAELSVPEGLYSADFPPMMLQSLVENAIKHGLEPKPEGGALSVAAEVVHGKLAVSVADTGVGFGRAATAGTGTGLSSIRERLKMIYGAEAELRLADNSPTGTRATIVVPYRSV